MTFDVHAFLNAIVYAVLGIVIFVLSFILIDKATPYDLWRELVEDKNMALAIVTGAAALGISIIIAAAIH